MGVQGMPRRYATYPAEFQTYHEISTYGSWILAVGVVLMVINLVAGLFNKEKALLNQYGSLSLEFTVPSPPPHENFKDIPTVTDWTYGYGKK